VAVVALFPDLRGELNIGGYLIWEFCGLCPATFLIIGALVRRLSVSLISDLAAIPLPAAAVANFFARREL